MIRVTEKAEAKLIELLEAEKATMIRFGLQGGGCNGFTYNLMIESEQSEEDIVYPLGNSYKILVDIISHGYLEEAVIEYKKDIMGESFVFINPMQKSSCGCGNSVSF